MGAVFHLQIATPEKDFFSGPVECVVLSTTDGEIGVLAGHSSMAVALGNTPMRIKTAEGWKDAAIFGGFARINSDYVIVFADLAEWPEDIEETRALEAVRRAEERMQAKQSEIEYMRNRVALERALTLLSMKQDHKYD